MDFFQVKLTFLRFRIKLMMAKSFKDSCHMNYMFIESWRINKDVI